MGSADEATEPIIDAALRFGRPFAVVPCCVFPRLFPQRELPRGRADLFNLVLGHISRSYLLWTYMGMLIKDAPPSAHKRRAAHDKENRASAATNQALAEKDRLLAEKDAEIEALRAQLAQLQTSGHSPASSAYSLSPLSSPLKPLSPL